MYEKFLIFVAWIVIVLGVGLWAGRVKKITSKEEWSVAGRSFRWITNFFTAHATQLSALTFMGFPGLLYSFGVPVFYAHYIFYALGTCAFFVLFGPKIWRLGKRLGHVTPTDALTFYYGGGRWFAYLIAALLFLALIPYVQLQVAGMGFTFEAATDGLIPAWLGALIFYIVVVIYVWYGGMRAVAYTDVVQGIMLLCGLWFGAISIIAIVGGGVGNIFSRAVEKLPQLMTVSGYKGWNWAYTISWAAALGAGWGMHAHMWLRMYTPKSEKAARMWSSYMFGQNLCNGIVLTLAMLAVALATPGLKPDMAFLQTIGNIWPPAIYGVMLAAVSAAIFSTIDSQIHAIGLIVTHDFVERSGKQLTERQFIWLNRIIVVVVTFTGYVLAFTYPTPLGFLGGYAAALGFVMMPPVLAMCTAQKWVTKEGVAAGLIVGYIVLLITGTGPLTNLLNIYCGMWGFIANTVTMIVVSLFTKSKPPKEAIEAIINAGW
jgi:SSS family solute:Na+ symporter